VSLRTGLACILIAVAPANADDVFSGKWKLNESKAKPTGAYIRSVEIEIDAARVKLVYQGVDADSQPVGWTIHASFGGNLNGLVDVPGVDGVRCWRSDAHTVMLKLTKAAETVGWDTMEISKNGKTLRLIHAVLDSKGKESKTVFAFDKE
jgi:hypothetical protein